VNRVLRFAVISLIVLLPSCNQQFDPRQEHQPKLVVFSILSTDRSIQFARVEQDYMPPDYNPLDHTSDNSVLDATITLRDGGTTYRLADTLLPRSDTSRYKSAIRGFVLRSFLPVFGKTYELSATTSLLGNASASVTIPTKPVLDMGAGASAVLDKPLDYATNAPIGCTILLSSLARGYLGHLYVYFDVLEGSEWNEGRVEIPLRFMSPQLKSLEHAVYPQLTGRPSRNQASLIFNNELYRAALSSIADSRFRGKKLIYKWAVFQLTQMEKNLFNYYNTVHSFRDAHTIRLDEPVYSNISGGYGLVGAYTLDSLVHVLPENFSFNNY
jgi:hypothetical protein